MNPEQFHDAMNHLDDDLVAGTDALRRVQKKRRFPVRWIIPLAACLALFLVPRFLPAAESNGTSTAGANGYIMDTEMSAEQIYGGAEVSIQESKSEYVVQSVSCGDIYMELPETWDYELEPGSDSLFIVIRPAGEEGTVKVGYWPGFAVCGTGLTTEPREIAGMTATVGTYDGGGMWSFITFEGDYVVLNEGADSWSEERRELLMKCLETLAFG